MKLLARGLPTSASLGGWEVGYNCAWAPRARTLRHVISRIMSCTSRLHVHVAIDRSLRSDVAGRRNRRHPTSHRIRVTITGRSFESYPMRCEDFTADNNRFQDFVYGSRYELHVAIDRGVVVVPSMVTNYRNLSIHIGRRNCR